MFFFEDIRTEEHVFFVKTEEQENMVFVFPKPIKETRTN